MAEQSKPWRVPGDPDFPRLWQRLKDGDQDAWHDLVCDILPLLHRWCRAEGLAESDASDVMQNVLIAVMEASRKPGHAPPHSFIDWLRQVTHNKIADKHRARPPEKLGLDQLDISTTPAGEPPAKPASPKLRRLRKVIRQVRPMFQENTWQVFWLTTAEGRPLNDVAAELGMTVNAVTKARSRVRDRFRKACIDREWERQDPPDDTPGR